MKMEQQNGVILINNLFTGEYISEDSGNIGHEIINLYKSDNGNFYIYANPYGNVDSKWDNRIKHIIFVRSISGNKAQVIAKAMDVKQILTNAQHANKAATQDTQNKEKQKAAEQQEYITANNIKYGGVSIEKIFSENISDINISYFVTFLAQSVSRVKQDKEIYLSTDINDKENCIHLEKGTRITNEQLKRYVQVGEADYKRLNDLINDESYWEDIPNNNIVNKIKLEQQENPSLLKIIKKQNDEIVVSNLIAYFLENDLSLWEKIATEVLKIPIIDGKKPKITRETKNNIDLFIEYGTEIIIIENKIKSRINGIKENGESQLSKYYKYGEEYAAKKGGLNTHYYLLRPDYNTENIEDLANNDDYTQIRYSQILKVVEKHNSKWEYYDELKNVVKKHSSEFDNELYEILETKFVNRIKSEQKKK
ncbi:hypothetical protein AGMMS49982_13210 [Bacteroidia bacterium]|nr:hypothetical protein AGMMS49982_13210 [Bacteroidia bacterium]